MAKHAAKPKQSKPADPHRLVRESPGSYQTEDGRLHVRLDAAGAWYVTDDERTNELGLELVLGPFRSLADAKAAVVRQREEPAGEPLLPTRDRA